MRAYHKTAKAFYPIFVIFPLLIGTTGCGAGMSASNSSFWEGTKTLGRYLSNQGKSLLGAQESSRQVSNRYEFYHNAEEEFIPLEDQDIQSQYADYATPQPKVSPGEPSSIIPGIEGFRTPGASLARLFRNIYFNTDQHTAKTQDDYDVLHKVASYLKKNPSTFVFICGHCDERAGEAYNLALGTRRSNFTRNLLIKEGVNPEQLFTVSYGKERPAKLGHNKEAWSQNRRVEFKLFDNTKPL
ncbi:MAG: Peptidoglycan-associated lipoprotein [Chlamydiia bacterium]|nr:Peptidoglycan-associated lipoprotein [Chlamydiia bacterium]